MGTGTSTSPAERNPHAPRWKARLICLIAAVWLGAGLVGVAGAQDLPPDPGEETVDTDQTPVAKPSGMWRLEHGTPYERSEPDDGSVTSFDTDLYAVGFRDEDAGYAGGSRCADPPVREPGESDASYGGRVSDCERVPVMYRFTDTLEFGEVWEEADLQGGGKPGFVGEIEWIDSDRALAVGGDGRYPRRELAREPGESFEAWAARDPAGEGRAWLLEDGSWRELDLSREQSEGMRGMTALAFHPTAVPELGVAGALGQVWHWEAGRFTEMLDRDSPEEEMFQADLFDTRVRDIGFRGSRLPEQMVAVTSGCCKENEGEHVPRVLVYDGEGDTVLFGRGKRWYVEPFSQARIRLQLLIGDEPEHSAGAETPAVHDASLYALRVGGSASISIRTIVTPGGPESEDEPPSQFATRTSQGAAGGGGCCFGVFTPGFAREGAIPPDVSGELSTIRLVDGDGPGTGEFPWSVGALRSTELEGLGAQAVARATHLEREQGIQWGTDDGSGMPFVEDEDRVLHPQRSLVFRLPSYSVNALDVIGNSGTGWAVGDRGAVVRLSESGFELGGGRAGAEPPADRVGRAREAGLSDSSPFDGFRPVAGDVEAGAVPSLRSRPRQRLAERRLVGAPGGGAVREIVMSRDGSEGWAVGEGLYRYVDGEWGRCEIEGSPGRPADPACAGLAGLSGQIWTAARVPLERGDDPSRADEFEVVALGPTARVLRYRDGRWQPDELEPVEIGAFSGILGGLGAGAAVVFTAPDDGWLLTREDSRSTTLYGPGQSNTAQRLVHFNGERWRSCQDADYDCGDPDDRLFGVASDHGGDNSLRFVLEGLVAVGERVYAFGWRVVADGTRYPLVVYRDREGKWRADEDEAGMDPAFEHLVLGEGPPPEPEERGLVDAIAVTELSDGGLGGWAVGELGVDFVRNARVSEPDSVLWRLQDGRWEPFSDGGAGDDFMRRPPAGGVGSVGRQIRFTQMLAMPRGDGGIDAVLRGLVFREDAQRFELQDADPPVPQISAFSLALPAGPVAPDGEGGFWMAGSGGFYRYTDRPLEPVFSEVPVPVSEGRPVRGVAGARDGSVWLATDRDVLYRYDRVVGWDRVRIPGWDPGAVVTSPSPVNAIAVAPDGSAGVAVGPGGRIARLGRSGAVLDRAAGRACDLSEPVAPCSTGRNLRAVDVAPDGSAIAAGDRLALLWRPSGGEFRAIDRPQAAASTNITGVSMPRADRAWIATSIGRIFRGELEGERWSWAREAVDVPVRDLELDASGHGYAVGDGGLILERAGDGQSPWQRMDVGLVGNLVSVSLPVGGGRGALVGGEGGRVLTLVGGRWEIARYPSGPSVSGIAMLPGIRVGQTEAWVALGATQGASRLLHYSSDPGEELLSPVGRVEAVVDAPAPRPGEVTFAALGKSECHPAQGSPLGCLEGLAFGGTSRHPEVIARRAAGEIAARSRREGGPVFSVWTGDAIDAASARETEVDAVDFALSEQTVAATVPRPGAFKLRRWRELMADRMERSGVPLLGAIGPQDLAEYRVCERSLHGDCETTHEHARSGDNLQWRQAFAGRRAPWGDGSDPRLGPERGLSFRPVPGSGSEIEGEGLLGGASTHYAVDVEREGEAVMRLVFADSSLRSLSASDAQQQPTEPSGQALWLERVLCRQPGRAPTGERCTRPADLPAVVVTNTPTYSYGPSPGTETMTDASAFEAILMRHRVSVGVAGRLGWNARYWATAPGLHEPCPGGSYRDEPPQPGVSACGETAPGLGDGSVGVPEAPDQAELVADALGSAGAPAPPGIDPGDPAGLDPEQVLDSTGADAPVSLLPFVVSSSSGGKLAEQGGQARDGYWEGYSIVRVPADGDPRGVIVEQRPVYDHVILTAQERRLRPGQRVTLRGYGRGPITSVLGGGQGQGERARFDRIDSDAVTHRYDLFEADPERPYLPREDASGEYVPLDPSIATVDRETGVVQAGRGDHEQTFAIAVLSVGEHAASYPMVFEPRRSFRAVRSESPPVPLPTPQASAPVPQVQGVPAAPPPPPPPPPPAPPPPGVSTPPFPALPALPSLSAPPTIGPSAAPTPPPTPPLPTPPTFSQAAPLGIAAEVGAIGVQGSVVPPSPPPVNPAPPGGSAARKEAKQRQAATAKSEEGEGVGEANRDVQGDLAGSPSNDAPGSNAMTRTDHPAVRRAQDRPAPSFTPVASEQPSAWSRGLVYGAGLGGMALILALGWSTLRPGPRRREPDVPAPAWARHGPTRPR